MGDLDAFDRVIASIHDAMLDDSRWRDSSALIDEACGTKGNHLVIVDRHARVARRPARTHQLRRDLPGPGAA